MKKTFVQIKEYIVRPRNVIIGTGLFSALALSLMLLALFVSQRNLKTSQDIRQQASSGEKTAKVILGFEQEHQILVKDQTNQIVVTLNTNQLATTGLQWVFDITSDQEGMITELEPEVYAESQLANDVNVQAITGGYRVKIYAFVQPKQPFTTNSHTKVVSISFKPTKVGHVTITTDNTRSHSTLYGVVPPDDRLTEIKQMNFSVPATPLDTPTPTPTAVPEATNTPTTTPTLTPTPTAGTGGITVVGCNEECESHAECQVGQLCYDIGSSKRCRLSTNPTNTKCEGLPDQGLSRSCNQYCADSRECADGLTCWYNQCRLASNIESTTCRPLSSTQLADQQQLCNAPCNSNNDCAINLRCYQGACRLAVNPTSPTCSLPPIKLPHTTRPTTVDTHPPKGAVIPTPVVSPTSTANWPTPTVKSANSTGSTNSSESADSDDSGLAAPVTPKITPAPTPPAQPNALSELISNLRNSGRLLPVGVLVIGVILLLSSILAGMLSPEPKKVMSPPRSNQVPPTQLNRSGQISVGQTTQQTTSMTDRLRKKGVNPPIKHPK